MLASSLTLCKKKFGLTKSRACVHPVDMTDNDVARILSTLQGAYPNNGPGNGMAMKQTSETWRKVLLPVEPDIAERAANVWISTEKWWPTPAEFLKVVDGMRKNDRQNGRGDRIVSTTRCDGSGWINKGNGMEPCPACSPWLYELHQAGEINRLIQPPAGYVMPPPCKRIDFEAGPSVGWARAMDALTRGYREQKLEDGLDEEQAEEAVVNKASRLMAFATKKEKLNSGL